MARHQDEEPNADATERDPRPAGRRPRMRYDDGTIVKERASDSGIRVLLYWIMGVMLAIILLGAGGLFGNIYSRLDTVETRTNDNRERVTKTEEQVAAVRRDVDQLKRATAAYNARVGAIEQKVFGKSRTWSNMDNDP